MGGPVEGVEDEGGGRNQGRLKRRRAAGPGWETGRGRSWEEGHRFGGLVSRWGLLTGGGLDMRVARPRVPTRIFWNKA